jgi:hypothetical protein
MLKRITLISNEQRASQLLSQDDFNYDQFNHELLNLDLAVDIVEQSESASEAAS